VLSGTLAAFTAWTVNSKDGGAAAAEQGGVPALLLAAYGATRTVRHASEVSLPNAQVISPLLRMLSMHRIMPPGCCSFWAITIMSALR